MDWATPCDGELGDGRVIGVEDEGGAGRGVGQRFAPERRHVVDLAVTVELVAEEVRENQEARFEGAGGSRQCCLVRFEQAEGPPGIWDGATDTGGAEQAGGDATHEVAAFAIVDEGDPGNGEGFGNDAGSGCLTVGARDQDAAATESPAEVGRQGRVHAFGHKARERRATAAAQQAGATSGQLACLDCGDRPYRGHVNMMAGVSRSGHGSGAGASQQSRLAEDTEDPVAGDDTDDAPIFDHGHVQQLLDLHLHQHI